MRRCGTVVDSSRIAVLHEGKVAWCGPSQALADTGDAYIDRLINKWKMERTAA